MPKQRIEMTDTEIDAFIKMAEGNPGAATVLTDLLNKGGIIDPQLFAGGLGAILLLDTFGIYGSQIWMLYKDVCKGNLKCTMAVLRACQLGHISTQDIFAAIDNRGAGIDVKEILTWVKGELIEFGGRE